MNVEDIRRIAVTGAGIMGHGIAQDFASAGYEVSLHDLTDERLRQAAANIRKNLEMLADMGLADATEIHSTTARIHCYTDLSEAVDGVQLVVECVVENLAVKQQVFRELDDISAPDCILATNTSSFLPSALASVTKRPERVLATHYFNPAYLLPFAEVVPGPETAEEVTTAVFELLKKVGKTPLKMAKEVVGFVANRLQAAMYREALSMVNRGIATPEEIDLSIRNGFGRRLAAIGAFQALDLAGWDTAQATCRNIFPDLESSTEVPALMEQKISQGDLGLKTGKGVYSWTSEAAGALKTEITQALVEAAKRGPEESRSKVL